MNDWHTKQTHQFTGCASLAAIGVKVRQLKLFDPIRTQGQIRQKTVKHTQASKLSDAFISLVAGVHGLVAITSRLRTDPARPHAFGRKACAEQSVGQETLDACTGEHVSQRQHSLEEIYRSHSQGFRHDYHARLQLLEVARPGLPCGPTAAVARHRLLCWALPPPRAASGARAGPPL